MGRGASSSRSCDSNTLPLLPGFLVNWAELISATFSERAALSSPDVKKTLSRSELQHCRRTVSTASRFAMSAGEPRGATVLSAMSAPGG